ncbi:hypothetical protein [Spirosoma sordidisoli]|uniref:Lipoprotein n=1 Tax=Spirosoma sordidisoli TaxID=2502893 RepID=A0A4Q2UR03_9BACT|nr:hypothetical protein [Spirosoma sordidisoli]RYC70080.1 hypothetical protein EQG79_09420 [Spirosoma sordidisoli]
MMKLITMLLSVLSLAACDKALTTPSGRTSTATGADLSYEADSPEPDDDEPDDANARLAALPKGKLTFQYMNNETEVFRPLSYTVALWRTESEPTATDPPPTKPTYRVVKKTGRSYVRKTVNAGWYIAQYLTADGYATGGFFKFQVAEGSNGLLCYNENSFSSVHFRGYYPSFGKLKCSWKTAPANEATANLTLSKDGTAQNFWLYAEDGTGKYRGQYWFMPTGTYSFSMPGLTNAGSLTIARTGKFPHLRFF